ncbi:MAG: class I SAM-dependent methyltransferase [Betaproteobacteria bacterium]|nr:class I SAM-dependent methyltransferase [Betaproteobacteria bacterium]MDE2124762.1 class I SAM-dependent methyltransferase [Betaproteobacteria bacterium]MDE2187466.1 class I SAM-dependent methyltransferase [Betaproteobacteria bacterium]MDE2325328.1 class I SAM-dependent methyltransferase [Betaproteobacteria bacterium]
MAPSPDLDGYTRAVARHFDARTDYSRSPTHARLAERLVALAAPQAGERVLDVATGTGFVAIAMARVVGEQGTVLGVDLSAGMLAQGRAAIAAAGLRNVTMLQADAQTLPGMTGGYDLICCCNALPYMPDVPAALQRWCALLRPGGRLAFNCWAENSYATGRLLREHAARHGVHVAMVGRDTGTPERCRTVLAAAGFAHTHVVVEPTAHFFSAAQLAGFLDMAVNNPLYGIIPADATRLGAWRDAYALEANSTTVSDGIAAEAGAYFVVAHKLPTPHAVAEGGS